jgi:hypothetical protein
MRRGRGEDEADDEERELDDFEDEDDMEMNLSKRGALHATIDQIPLLDEFAAPTPSLVQPAGDANAIRPEEQVIDNTAYYNCVSLWTCVYIRVKEGIALPIVFDAKTQHMILNKRIAFDW